MELSASTSAEPVKVKQTTASLVEQVLEQASKKVLQVLTDENVALCFPSCAENNPELMETIKTMVKEGYKKAEPEAWAQIMQESDFKNKAADWDRIVSEAQARRANGEEPCNFYLHAHDANLTFSSATVPLLADATKEIRAKRLELQKENQRIIETVLVNQTIVERSEKQMQDILEDFRTSLAALREADMDTIDHLKSRMVQVVPEL